MKLCQKITGVQNFLRTVYKIKNNNKNNKIKIKINNIQTVSPPIISYVVMIAVSEELLFVLCILLFICKIHKPYVFWENYRTALKCNVSDRDYACISIPVMQWCLTVDQADSATQSCRLTPRLPSVLPAVLMHSPSSNENSVNDKTVEAVKTVRTTLQWKTKEIVQLITVKTCKHY